MNQITEQLSFDFKLLSALPPDFKLSSRLKTTELAWKSIAGDVTNNQDIISTWIGDSGFENFVKDMGERQEGDILIKVNRNKIFCKNNCRWINWREYALLRGNVVGRFTHQRLIRIKA